jgi:hypothetical protein
MSVPTSSHLIYFHITTNSNGRDDCAFPSMVAYSDLGMSIAFLVCLCVSTYIMSWVKAELDHQVPMRKSAAKALRKLRESTAEALRKLCESTAKARQSRCESIAEVLQKVSRKRTQALYNAP